MHTTSFGELQAGLAVSPEELRTYYVEFANEVATYEEELEEDLPGGSSFGVHQFLQRMQSELDSKDRIFRTLPVANAYHYALDQPLPDDLKRGLVGFDAQLNAIDDIVDDEGAGTTDRADYVINVLLGELSLFENLPPEVTEEIARMKTQYFTEIAQIVRAEHYTTKRINAASSVEECVDILEPLYEYRGGEILAHAEIISRVMNVDPSAAERIEHNLKIYRARQWLFEDVRHVERDLEMEDSSPVIELLEVLEHPAKVAETVERVADRFQYDVEGQEYIGMLRKMEDRPDDLEATISDALESTRESDRGVIDGPTSLSTGQISDEYVQFATTEATTRGENGLSPVTHGVLAVARRGGTVESLIGWAEKTGVAGRNRVRSKVKTLSDMGIIERKDGDDEVRLDTAIDVTDRNQLVSITLSALI